MDQIQEIKTPIDHSGTRAAEPLDHRRDALYYAVLLSVAVLPYLNTLGFGFVYDDNYQIVENPYVHSFHYLKQILISSVWSFKYSRIPTNYYRPLMSLEYVFLYKTYGPIAYVFHLANVLTHAAVVVLLFAVGRRLLNSERVAFLAAVLFALDPVHTESVAWVAAIPDIQLALFLMIAFWFYLEMGEPSRSQWWTPVAMNGVFFLALFSKEPAVAFPVIAVFYEHLLRADRDRTNWKQKLGRYGPLFILTGVYLIARVLLIGGLIPKLQRPRLSWPSALLSAVSLFGKYMNKLAWPVRLKMFYAFRAANSLRDPGFLIGVAWILSLGLLCWFLWKRNRPLVLPVLWMVATLAPALQRTLDAWECVCRTLSVCSFNRVLLAGSQRFAGTLGGATSQTFHMGPRRHSLNGIAGCLAFRTAHREAQCSLARRFAFFYRWCQTESRKDETKPLHSIRVSRTGPFE